MAQGTSERAGYTNEARDDRQALVRLITKPGLGETVDWLELARNPERGAVRVRPEEMDGVYHQVERFMEDRRNYGGGSHAYYLPAFQELGNAREQGDFETFRNGLNQLLSLIAND